MYLHIIIIFNSITHSKIFNVLFNVKKVKIGQNLWDDPIFVVLSSFGCAICIASSIATKVIMGSPKSFTIF